MKRKKQPNCSVDRVFRADYFNHLDNQILDYDSRADELKKYEQWNSH